jgi:hypothetical protein
VAVEKSDLMKFEKKTRVEITLSIKFKKRNQSGIITRIIHAYLNLLDYNFHRPGSNSEKLNQILYGIVC